MTTKNLNPALKYALALVLAAGGSGLMVRGQTPQAVATWAPMGAIADGRVGTAVATLADGRTLMAGGTVAGTATASVVIYDPLANSFSAAGQMSAARVGHTATLLEDGRVLIAGGAVGGVVTADVEIFNLTDGSSTLAGTMGSARAGHGAARLADGTVLVVGGSDGTAALATTEMFDPATGATTAAGALSVARSGASATTLIDGRVLVAGGFNGTTDLASAEMFSPFAQTFDPVPTALSVARSGHAAVLLPHNHGVLIAGGTAAGVMVQTTDLFLPAEFPDPYSYGMGAFAPVNPMATARTNAASGPAGDNGYAFVAGGGSADAEQYRFATIKTDKDDYPPGVQAVITGSGWQPNEIVTLRFQEDPAVHPDYVLQVQADMNGEIYWDQWAPEEHDLNVRFYLLATDSRSRAQTTFTDSNSFTVAPLSQSVAAGSTTTFSWVFTAQNSANVGTTTFTIPAGWTAPQLAPGPGRITLTPGTCAVTLNGISGQVVTINQAAGGCNNNTTFTLTYSTATAPTPGSPPQTYTFVNQHGQDPTVTVTAPAGPTKLVITSVNSGSDPTYGNPFSVAVQSQNASNVATNVVANTVFSLSVATGTGGLTGTVTGTILAGQSSTTVTGVTYAKAENGVSLTATRTSGDTVTPGTSALFNVLTRAITVTAVAATKVYDGTTTSAGVPTLTSGTLASGDTANFTQSFDSRHVGSRTLTPAGTVTDGNGGGNYTVTLTTASGTITTAALTIAAVADSKAYDGTTSSAATPTVSGLISPDTVSGLVQAFDSKNAGARTLAVSTYTVNDGNGGANYTVTATTASGTITPAPLTIAAVTDSKVYDGTTASTATPTVSGLISPDTVTALTQEFDSKNAGARTLAVSTYTVNDGNGGANYTVTATTASGTITPAPLTIAAVTDSKVYDGTTTSTATPTVSGLQTGDTASAVQAFDTRNAGPRTLSIASYTVADGNGGANYTVTETTASGTITPAPLTIAAVTDSKIYDGTTTSSATPTVSGLISPDTVSGLVQAFDSKDAGPRTLMATSYAISDGNGGNNYSVTTPTANGTITPAPLTIAAVTDSKIYDGTTASTATPTVTGLQSGDTASAVQAFDSRDTGARTLAATSYTVADGNGGANYTVTQTTASGTITPAPLTIAAVTDSKVYDGTTTSTATPAVTGLQTGDTASAVQAFDSRNTGARTLAVASYTVADGNGGANYTVTQTTASGTITPAPLTIAAVTDSKVYDGTTTSTATPTVSGLISPDTASALVQAFDSRNAGARTLSVAGYTVNDGNGGNNYSVTTTTASGSIAKAPLTVTASSHTLTFNDPVPTITPGYSGFVPGDVPGDLTSAPSCATTYTVGSLIGTYPSSCSAAASGNYNFTYVGGTVKVLTACSAFNGFLSPIGGAVELGSGGSFADPVRAFKLNSTIPVKFGATCFGSALTTGIHTLQAIKYSSSTTSDPAIDATPTDAATAGNQFRLTGSDWHFNLSTKGLGTGAQGIWLLTATLFDGSTYSVWITIKK